MTRKGIVVMTILLLAMTGKYVAKLCRKAEVVPVPVSESPWEICPYAFNIDWFLSDDTVRELTNDMVRDNLFVTETPSETHRRLNFKDVQ